MEMVDLVSAKMEINYMHFSVENGEGDEKNKPENEK